MEYGTDLLLTKNALEVRDLAATAGGDIALVTGGDCVVQDLITRLECRLGTLFYDVDFGSKLYEFLHVPVTKLLLKELETEVETRVELNPRVEYGTIKSAAVFGTTPEEAVVAVSFELIGEDSPRNLVVTIGGSTVKVEEDYRP